jgi:Ca2+-binding RTX toxin-like protein
MPDNPNVYQGALGHSRPNDVQISADGTQIYAASFDGNLYVYSSATGSLLHTWHVGTTLGGLDISPDGSFAIAVELGPVSGTYVDPWWDNEFGVTVHKVDLATGQVTDYPTILNGDEYSFFDVAVEDSNRVLLTEQILPGWSGWAPMRELNLATGQYRLASDIIRMASVLSPSNDGSYTFVSETDISDARLDMYRRGVGMSAFHGWYADGIEGNNAGVQAISGEAGLAVQGLWSEINVYDLNLHLQHSFPMQGVAGLTFDQSGDYLFVLTTDDVIYQIFTPQWLTVNSFAVGADVSTVDGDFGNRLLVAPDMSYFTVVTEGGLVMVDAASSPPITENGNIIPGTLHDDTIDALGGDDTVYGRAGNDQLSGGAGNDHLYGDDGNDSLSGGSGDDILNGGAGTDTANFWSATARVIVDLAGSGTNAIGEGTDTLISIENVEGTRFDDRLFGDGAANVILGRAGDDTIVGRAGADVLFGSDGNDALDGGADSDRLEGGAGNDTLVGGTGDDILDGGTGIDTVDYWSAQHGLSVDLAASGSNATGEGSDTIIGVENVEASGFDDWVSGNGDANLILARSGDDTIFGQGGADTLFGGSGNDYLSGGDGDDRLEGEAGADILAGGSGNDILNGGDGIDTVDYWSAQLGLTIDLAIAGPNATGEGADTLIGIENVEASAFNDTVSGDDNNNVILARAGDDIVFGHGGDDLLFGGNGNDQLDGGAGADRLEGAAGNDVLVGGSGNDILDGGDGVDTVDFWLADGHVSIDLASGTATSLATGNDVLIGIENVEATRFDDDVSGNEFANVIAGRGGNDSLFGRGGDDVLFGGAGDDHLSGGDGNDRIEGGEGHDDLNGGAGNDVLDGGAGPDSLTGGDGADDFVFANLGDTDSIVDFSRAEDIIDLSPLDANSTIDGDQAFTFIGNAEFSAAGQLKTYVSGGTTFIAGDVDGDGVADFLISVPAGPLQAANFHL